MVGLEPQGSQVSSYEHVGNLKKMPVIYMGNIAEDECHFDNIVKFYTSSFV